MNSASFVLVGVVIGCILGWLWRTFKPPTSAVESELRQQRSQLETDLAKLREQLTAALMEKTAAEGARANAESQLKSGQLLLQESLAAADQIRSKLENELQAMQQMRATEGAEFARIRAELEAREKSLGELRCEFEKARASNVQFQEQLFDTKQRNGGLEKEIKLLNERLATERQQIETVQEQFKKEFAAISNQLFVDNSKRFNEHSSQSLEKLLTPLKDTLGEFRKSLDTTRTETATHSAVLKDQIGRIGLEAANLANALKGQAKTLGNWGENMLDQILEKSGLQRDVHYRRQLSAKDGEGDRKYLDVIIDLPDKRHLVIDSKVSLRNYEEWMNGVDEAQRSGHLAKHIDCLRAHFRSLGTKRYQDVYGINAPDFVLMYVPVEGAFFAAITQTPTLFSEAIEKNVVLITNSTLLATLRTVAHVWGIAQQQKNAEEIADRGAILYDKFAGFIDDMERVGKAISGSQAAWEDAFSKLHKGKGNLVSQAEKLRELGIKPKKQISAVLTDVSVETQETLPEFTPRLIN